MELTTKRICAIVAIVIVCSVVATATIMYFSYNNSDARFRNLAEAQRGNIENVYDRMWKNDFKL